MRNLHIVIDVKMLRLKLNIF